MGMCQMVPKFDFQSQFCTKNHQNLSRFFFSLKNINLGTHFLLLKFFNIINFLTTSFSKTMSYFGHLPITPTLKVQQFPLIMLIFRQKIFLILYPPLKNFTTCITITVTLHFRQRQLFSIYCRFKLVDR